RVQKELGKAMMYINSDGRGRKLHYRVDTCNRKHFGIVTDRQEAVQLLRHSGRSAKASEVVQNTLQRVDAAVWAGIEVTVLWTPAHSGIPGNEAAHRASQKATLPGCKPVRDARLRVREKSLMIKKLEADRPWKCTGRDREKVGRQTYDLDAALPGKHTLMLYGLLSREDAGILA
ncbi:hypothetical protein LTR53_014536, partial [Teratosphaeriaceae sp. CCFEE 6253]